MNDIVARAVRRTRYLAGTASVVSLAALAAAGSRAADTAWTGGAGPSQSFWDLAANWSAGPPLAATTRALLGSFDTALRSGFFEAATLQGTGTLTMTGGELLLQGSDSTLGKLDLRGGNLHGAGGLSVQQLNWSGGSLGRTAYSDPPLALTVAGAASISGHVDAGLGPGVARGIWLLGETTWQPGASSIDGGARLTIGPNGVFHDRASGGDHGLVVFGTLTNQGRYEKTGARTTSISAFPHFSNAGTFTVREGLVRFHGEPGHDWNNTGRLEIAGGQVEMKYFRSQINNGGSIDVLAGRMSVSTDGDAVLRSTGDWVVAPGALLELIGSYGAGAGGPWPAFFEAGTLHNAGTLRFMFGTNEFRAAAGLTGPGAVEVLDGAAVNLSGWLDMGSLRIARPRPHFDEGTIVGYARSGVSLTGGLTVGALDWADGRLTVGAPVTVNGASTLSENVNITLGTGSEVPGKRMDVPFRFNGGVTWDGNSDLHGGGSMAIAAGTVFEDRNSVGTIEVSEYEPPTSRPTRIALAGGVDNAGTYLKTGAGPTEVESAFRNAGTVRSVDAGMLTFTAALDNQGTLESVRSRIVALGSLTQAAAPTLSGGRYVMRDGSIVLNLGANAAGTGPALIHVNAAELVLDGPQARLATTWMGSDFDALSVLSRNEGRLTLLHAAAFQPTGGSFHNIGLIEIGSSGRLGLAGSSTFYLQSWDGGAGGPGAVATWLDGTLEATAIWFSDGSFGAGDETGIGVASMLGDVRFGNARFDVDVVDAGHFDLVTVSGSVSLGGVLAVDFTGAPQIGRYRILTADAVNGSFGTVQSNLDPARYRIDALYGADHLELSVTAVPEPGRLALLTVGVLLLGLRGRRVLGRRCPLAAPLGS